MSVIREFYAWLYDILGPSHNYPRAIQRLIYEKKHLNNKERFTLVIFFLVNGVDPHYFVRFLGARFNFDNDAKRHILYLIKKFPTSRWKSWNVAEKRTTH